MRQKGESKAKAVRALIAHTVKRDGLLKGPLAAVARHVKQLQGCTRDLQPALQELRHSMARLREEVKVAKRLAIRPPPLSRPGRAASGDGDVPLFGCLKKAEDDNNPPTHQPCLSCFDRSGVTSGRLDGGTRDYPCLALNRAELGRDSL